MSTTAVILACLGAVALAVLGAFLLRRRKAEAPFHHFRCPGCRRRLRYRTKQVGHAGSCSHCGRNLTFPPVSESID
jgi:hypothetical protein